MNDVSNYLIIKISTDNITLKSYNSNDNKLLKNEIFKIYESNSKRFFVYEKDSVYIDYDAKPIFKESLIKYFAKKIKVPKNELSSDHFTLLIAFIIDRNGKIINKGYLGYCSNEGYKKQIVNILDNFNLKPKPAKVDNKNVAVLYSFNLDFFDNEFLKYNKN